MSDRRSGRSAADAARPPCRARSRWRREHADGLRAALADGELWRALVHHRAGAGRTSRPTSTAALAQQAQGDAAALRGARRAPARSSAARATTNSTPAVAALEIGYTWYAQRVQRTGAEHRGQAAAARRMPSRRWAARRSSSADELVQPRARAPPSRAWARSRTASLRNHMRHRRRHAARHRGVLDHRRRVAGGEAATSTTAGSGRDA